MTWEERALRSHLNMLLLAVLQHGALHGYQVREALRQRSGGRLEPYDRTVYSMLRRLEHLGLVSSTSSVVKGRPTRAYRLTPAGQDQLDADRLAWRDFVAVITEMLEPGPCLTSLESTQPSP